MTVEGEARLAGFQSRHGGDLVRIAVTRAAPVGERLGWRPLMPVTQLAVSKTGRRPMIEDIAAIGRASAIVERLTQGWRPWALLVGLCLGLYLPGIAAMPPLDRDEARFVQATRQMLESGDFIRIRFQDEARNKKPAGIYWLQAASVSLFSDAREHCDLALPHPLAARRRPVPCCSASASAPGSIGRPAALLGAMLLASCVLLVSEAHLAKTDAVLLATVVAAQGSLGEIYRRSRAREPGSMDRRSSSGWRKGAASCSRARSRPWSAC